jgi:hypothetical protein
LQRIISFFRISRFKESIVRDHNIVHVKVDTC